MYALKLGNMRLAPRRSIHIEEPDDFEVITVQSDSQTSGCPTGMVVNRDGTCSPIDKRSLTLKIVLEGGGSLKSAFHLKTLIDAELTNACNVETLLRRRVYDEPELIYTISRGYTRIIQPKSQYIPERIVIIELIMEFSAFRYGNALTYNSNACRHLIATGAFPTLDIIRYPSPIIVNTVFPAVTRTLAISKSPSPLVVVTSFPSITDSLLITRAVSSIITVIFSSPGFTRTLGGVGAAATIPNMYIPARKKIWSGDIDLNTDDIRVILLMSSTTADTELDKEFISQFTLLDEFNGAGYARVALANEAVNEDDPNARAEFDADDAAFGALSNGTRQIDAGIIYKHVTNDADSIPIFLLQFTNFNPGGSALTLTWDAEGIAHLT